MNKIIENIKLFPERNNGITFMIISIIFSILLLIYLSAGIAFDRSIERANIGQDGEKQWWEDQILYICPLH
ncbi:MAG: hypothetical protein CL714_00775 [Chloroflexi bacterium]|nr:hypothetical protein [Chloroflexota bacterium]MQG09015.1 hypothetical protein [SAR202 cluster bacterium]|tara:strand:- start:12515 stop:12727 length:213 start_codon:yes stop_codon:yes gene_type:complete